MFIVKAKDQYVKFDGNRIQRVNSSEEATKFKTESITKVAVSKLIDSNYHDVSYEQIIM